MKRRRSERRKWTKIRTVFATGMSQETALCRIRASD